MAKVFAEKSVSILLLALMFMFALPNEHNTQAESVPPLAQGRGSVTRSKHFPKLVDCDFEPGESELSETMVQETTWQPYAFVPLDHELQEQIYDLCGEHGLEYDLILAVIKTESEFNVEAVGDNGNSIGLMQIQPKWWQQLADENSLNIYEATDNVRLGIIILDMFIKENAGVLEKALKQYNSGDPNYEGNEYTDKVFSNYAWIKERMNETTQEANERFKDCSVGL